MPLVHRQTVRAGAGPCVEPPAAAGSYSLAQAATSVPTYERGERAGPTLQRRIRAPMIGLGARTTPQALGACCAVPTAVICCPQQISTCGIVGPQGHGFS
ncbi:MAG: hypothetical protein ACYC2G_11695 [Gemmatimonadaceae bacterium]